MVAPREDWAFRGRVAGAHLAAPTGVKRSLLLSLLIVAGCAVSTDTGTAGDPALGPADDPSSATDTPPPESEPFLPSVPRGCVLSSPAGPTTEAGFDHLTSGLFGRARHELSEPVVTLGENVSLEARFRYGLTSKDLEDEEVVAYVRLEACGEWTEVADLRTDDDGMIFVDLDPGLFPEVGAYEVEIVALGDLSRARGRIYVVPAEQKAVVFDIDGTLTTSDSQLFTELYQGTPAEMYEGAPDVAWLYAEAGYLIVYLTGRPHMLQDMSRTWLEDNHFPVGPVITSDNLLESTGPLVEQHKREHLALLEGEGITFARAYGNATTDICAYAKSEIDPAQTFIIGTHGGEACDDTDYAPTVAVESYPAHLASVDPLPATWE